MVGIDRGESTVGNSGKGDKAESKGTTVTPAKTNVNNNGQKQTKTRNNNNAPGSGKPPQTLVENNSTNSQKQTKARNNNALGSSSNGRGLNHKSTHPPATWLKKQLSKGVWRGCLKRSKLRKRQWQP